MERLSNLLSGRRIKAHKNVATINIESLEKLIFANIHFAMDVKLKTDK
jgi:hypothetical protein